jgi:hypothetical protein
MVHDYAVYGAIAAIFSLSALALVLGASDSVLATSIAVLAGLGGYQIGRNKSQG